MSSTGDFITRQTNKLFSVSYEYLSEDDALLEEYEAIAELLLQNYPWDDVAKSWLDFFYTQCTDAQAALNYANLFWLYGGYEKPVRDPYKFLGYLYYMLGDAATDDAVITLTDGLAIEILRHAGCTYADIAENPYYAPEKDAKILAAAAKWRDGKYN